MLPGRSAMARRRVAVPPKGCGMMDSKLSESRSGFFRHPLYLLLVAFPIACFFGALATDIAYATTADMIWADFSAWLLAVGIIVGVIAALAGLVNLLGHHRRRGPVLPVVICCLLVLVLAFFDNLIHTRDAWTSVVPLGLALSAVNVVVILVTLWLGSAAVSRRVDVTQA